MNMYELWFYNGEYNTLENFYIERDCMDEVFEFCRMYRQTLMTCVKFDIRRV